jgi:hypothetical protein
MAGTPCEPYVTGVLLFVNDGYAAMWPTRSQRVGIH